MTDPLAIVEGMINALKPVDIGGLLTRTKLKRIVDQRVISSEEIEQLTTTAELQTALNKIDQAESDDQLLNLAAAAINRRDKGSEAMPKDLDFTKAAVQEVLLSRRTEVLQRLASVSSVDSIQELRNTIEDADLEPAVREPLLKYVDESAAQAKVVSSDLAIQTNQTIQRREELALYLEHRERELTLDERRSKIRRAWFERESIASIVGAFLLLLLGIALIIAMFIGTATTEVVTSAFLLILGYFFGQATKRDNKE